MPGLIGTPASISRSTRSTRQLAGQPIDPHFGDRGAVGEIEKGMPLARLAIEIDAGRCIEAALAEVDPLEIRLAHQIAPADAIAPSRIETTPSANSTSSAAIGRSLVADVLNKCRAANSASRRFNRPQASTAAAPLRSVLAEAAVADVLLFLSVLVDADEDRSRSRFPIRRRQAAGGACSRPGPFPSRRCETSTVPSR